MIGLSDYPLYPQDRQIHFGKNDAIEFAKYLKTAPGGTFDTTLLVNSEATRSGILTAIKSVGKVASNNDLVYIFFAGHGAVDDSGQAYFMPYDADSKFPEGLGIRMDELLGDVAKNISSNVVFFIDACHAGAALQPGARGDENVVPKLTEEWTRAFKFKGDNLLSMGFFAASSNEVSWEDSVAEHGLFSEYLLEGIKGAADTNPMDGRITAQELFRYIELHVQAESKRRFKSQNPLRSPIWVGDFPLALYPPNLKSRAETLSGHVKGNHPDVAANQAELAQAHTEQRLETIRRERPLLRQFIREMPKGADLETHSSGSISPELWIDWAVKDGLCVDSKTSTLLPPSATNRSGRPVCAEGTVAAESAYNDVRLYQSMVDAFSMRKWRLSGESAYDHFNNTFAKFSGASRSLGRILAEMSKRAVSQHEIYQEILVTPSIPVAMLRYLNSNSVLSDNPSIEELARVHKLLKENGLVEGMAEAIEKVNEAESERDTILRCKSSTPDPACSVKQRYQYQVLRSSITSQVYPQMVMAFEVASVDPRFIGIGVAQPEGTYHSIHDFQPQMRMFGYLHTMYPLVRIGISAGQLSDAYSDLSDSSHIRDAIEIGKASRISHGTSLQYEQNPEELLRFLKERKVPIVIMLTSDDLLLDVKGEDHPFRWYLERGVLLALSTSDEGVLGTNLTQEFARAVESYGLSYGELKTLARNSLTVSFLAGESLWATPYQAITVKDCEGDIPGAPNPSISCAQFLSKSDKAKLQWQLESQLLKFEASF
nr:caspase family protein [Terriglobus roseus]